METVLYVGLPKTATTFYEVNLFPELDKKEIIFNPHDVMQKIGHILSNARPPSQKEVANFHEEINNIKKSNPGKILLIVNEHLGYWGWNPAPEFGVQRTKLLFPEAKIILSIRYQTDWLLSLYRHYMDVGGCGGIKGFLNYEDGGFHAGISQCEFIDRNYAVVKIDVFKADWVKYIECFINKYGSNNVNILFFEDFMLDKPAYTNNLCKIIGIQSELPHLNYESKSNKGRSALTCKLTETYCACCSFFSVKPRSILGWNQKVKERDVKNNIKEEGGRFAIIYWVKLIFFVLRFAPWQFFMGYLDKLKYFDWDILSRSCLRNELDDIYKKMNKDLLQYVSKDDIPPKYLS